MDVFGVVWVVCGGVRDIGTGWGVENAGIGWVVGIRREVVREATGRRSWDRGSGFFLEVCCNFGNCVGGVSK